MTLRAPVCFTNDASHADRTRRVHLGVDVVDLRIDAERPRLVAAKDAGLPPVIVAVAVAKLVADVVLRESTGSADVEITPTISRACGDAPSVDIGAEAEGFITAMTPKAISAAPDIKSRQRIRRLVRLQGHLTREQLA